MKRIVGVLAASLFIGGCASQSDLDKLEKKVEQLEENIGTLIEIQTDALGALGTRISNAERVTADEIQVPTFCSGRVVLWKSLGDGLTCDAIGAP